MADSKPKRRTLRTADEIRAAGAALAAAWPPLSKEKVQELAGILAPLAGPRRGADV
jgi:hypothetical protein